MLKAAILLVSLLFATPAFALYEFYVAQDPSTKECSITEDRPTGAPLIAVGVGAVYRTKSDAQNAMKQLKECH